MTTHRLSAGSTGSPPPRIQLKEQNSWTDDLPVCHLSGVGFSTNQIYRKDGFRCEEHEFEDRSIHFSVEDNIFLYGVFDGHDGSRVSNFAAQRMPAELLLGQLDMSMDDHQISEILRQAFVCVEKGFIDSIDEQLTEKAKLHMNLPEGIRPYEVYQQYPEIAQKIEAIDNEIAGGTTAVVALILNNKLHIANVGCSRALLCATDNQGQLRVIQLSVDHNLANEDELLRLEGLGVDVEKLRQVGMVGNFNYTRTIGDYNIKSGYKDIEILSAAESDPVIADPDVNGGIEINESTRFLILMSYGLYKSLEDASGTEKVNVDIASMVATEFGIQSTLNGLAQAVVDKAVRIHHDTFMTSTGGRKELCQKRKDITLLVRNFNFPLPNAINSPTGIRTSPQVGMGRANLDQPLSVIIPGTTTPPAHISRPFFAYTNKTATNTSTSTTGTSTYTSSNESTQSGGDNALFHRRAKPNNPLQLDADGKIDAYVDFTDFYEELDKLDEAEREAFENETEVRPTYETIPEETVPTPEQSPA